MSAVDAAPPPGTDAVASHSPIASFIDGRLPASLDWLRLDRTTQGAKPFTFRFCFNEVPFEAKIVRWDQRSVLSLTGALGTLPFTAESATRRQRLALIVAAAQRRTKLNWAITGRQEIVVSGDIDLAGRLTPIKALAGAVALMLCARPYADLIVAVGGED